MPLLRQDHFASDGPSGRQNERQPLTLPNTPLRVAESRHKLPKRNLAHIRLLTKLDLKLPFIPRGLTPLASREALLHWDQSSLYTTRTNRTIASRIFLIVPKRLRDGRSYYDDFTTIDWAKAYILTNKFNYEVHHGPRLDHEGETPMSVIHRAYLVMGKWILIVMVAFLFAVIAYFIDKIEILLVGFKHGYCTSNWFASQVSCCADVESSKCAGWVSWSELFSLWFHLDFVIYVVLTVSLACLAGLVTLTTKIPSRLPTSKEKIMNGVTARRSSEWSFDSDGPDLNIETVQTPGTPVIEALPMPIEKQPPRDVYTGAGSGVPEVKTILSGFVIRRFLGTYTLFAKTIALILAIASGMALGKEGPYVHLATCVGNVLTRFFPYINNNDLLKKQVLSASASSGVALAFGSPLGGVLFILEEINNYLPSSQLFLVFFCAMISTLFLKFLNPYGTNKTVLFELSYNSEWRAAELPLFVFIGIVGGIFGALFIKFTKWWPSTFRQLRAIKGRPLVEIACISLLTGVVTFWNPYTKQASAELILDLATSCTQNELDSSLCPTTHNQYVKEIQRLAFALCVKVVLSFVTFGLKVPSGIYVPSMVAGALFGRLFAMCVQLANVKLGSRDLGIMSYVCATDSELCVDLGIYSMISAGAFMAGVTRMNISLVTILFELTSSYTYVLPIAIAVAVANWLGGLLEENSLYESLLIANDYPFMSPENEAVDPLVSAGELLDDTEKLDNGVTIEIEEGELKRPHLIARQSTRGYKRGVNDESIIDLTLLGFSKDDKLHIDISGSPFVSSAILQTKLLLLAEKSLLDGCIPLIKDGVCVGTLYFSELEFCLDKLNEFSAEFNSTDLLFCKVFKTEAYDNSKWEAHREHNQTIVKDAMELARLQSYADSRALEDYFTYHSNDEYEGYENDRAALQKQLADLADVTDYVDTSPIFINHDSSLALAHLIFDRIGTRIIILQKDGKYYGVLHKKALIDYCRRPST